jgi:hypothetical protein
MAGNQTVKDLDRKARVETPAFEYFPVWRFKRKLKDGSEQILLQPAAATSVSELKRLNLPAGDLRKYDPSLDSQALAPSVPLQAALSWLERSPAGPDEIVERTLVHIPLYTFKYGFQGGYYTAVVEAGTGGVFANLYPAKAEAPYLLAGGVAALVFLCLALFPLVGAAIDENSGAWIGLLACTGLGGLAAPALFALAAWVAAKV